MDAIDQLVERTKQRIETRRIRPESTYRLQFHAGFRFADARAQSEYFRELGITHCYASPYLRARPGSTHGYDIIDHSQLNPEIGDTDDFDEWIHSLKESGLGHVLDIVPNHMGVATNENKWWNDVLENGPSSAYGDYFDIAWQASLRPELQNKVLLPVLGEPYGDVLEAGQLQVRYEGGAFRLEYFDKKFPLSPSTYGICLSGNLPHLEQSLGADAADLAEFVSIITACKNLPSPTETDRERSAERNREKEVIKRRLASLCDSNPAIREFIESNLKEMNGTPGDAHSFDALDVLIDQQCFRLAYWRVAPDEINYRRFFDINDLAALSMEKEEVFRAAHELPLRFVVDEKLDGLRIDHPDGLYDPAAYFRSLQEQFMLRTAEKTFQANPAAYGGDWAAIETPLRARLGRLLDNEAGNSAPLYVVAEKILGAEEPLIEAWQLHGTSGYDFVNMVNGLFIDSTNEKQFTRHYSEWIEDDTRFSDLVYRKKLLILQVSLASELNTLAHQLDRLAQKSRKSRDFTLNTLRRALREVIAAFPVYRSYIAESGPSETDRKYIDTAIRRARARNPLTSRRVFAFIRDMLLQQSPDTFTDADRAEQRRFAGKFQQVTAPVTAKGIEDTAFYIYNRLISLNEVGGEPDRFGVSPQAVHAYNGMRQSQWPYALSPLSTHDTKRSEDVRARINVLSELPEEWQSCLARWTKMNERLRVQVEDDAAPDRNEQSMLYQSLLGAWPFDAMSPEELATFVQRIQAYMEKALHEAKVHTSWINPNEDYDNAVRTFVQRLLDPAENADFLSDFVQFQKKISFFGMFNSLSQTLLKFTCPGVPDTYQGTELWDFSLVDPDNRRPVDYGLRSRMLRDLAEQTKRDGQAQTAKDLLENAEDGRIKLYITQLALGLRRRYPGLFTTGSYAPVQATGSKSGHVFAFSRTSGNTIALVVVPRLITRITRPGRAPVGAEAWGDTALVPPAGVPLSAWTNVFTGETLGSRSDSNQGVPVSQLLSIFPVAVLLSNRESQEP